MVAMRELRADLAAHVRRASAGERVVITVGGRAAAQLGPLEDRDGTPTMEALVAAGMVIPPRRTDSGDRRAPIPVWAGLRLDRALREVRG